MGLRDMAGSVDGCITHKQTALMPYIIIRLIMSLQVRLVSALMKVDEDPFSKNDPYVEFELGNEKKRSKTKEEGGNKVAFNEQFSFNSQDSNLKVTVYDDDTFVDDKLGQATINIAQYRQSGYPQDVEVIASQHGKPTCKVFLKITGSGQGGQGGQFGGQGGWGGQGGQGGQGGWGGQGGQGGQFGGQGGWGGQGGQQGNTQNTFMGAAQQLGQGGQGGQGW